jgi:two-component system cell cycle response regulator DivK
MAAEPVLIIDDNEINLKLARVILVGAGFEVKTAGDAEEALAVLAVFRPRVILMDIQLPGTDGLTLTRQLRDDRAYDDVIIIALTAYAMKGDEEKALAAGCDGYITKPIEPSALPVTIAEHLARGR